MKRRIEKIVKAKDKKKKSNKLKVQPKVFV